MKSRLTNMLAIALTMSRGVFARNTARAMLRNQTAQSVNANNASMAGANIPRLGSNRKAAQRREGKQCRHGKQANKR